MAVLKKRILCYIIRYSYNRDQNDTIQRGCLMVKKSEHEPATYELLTKRVDDLYTFAVRFLKYMNQPRDYLAEAKITPAEAQVVTMIYNHPGITITEAADNRCSTTGAISQIVSKLVKRGLVLRKKEDNNAKNVHLYLTENGVFLAAAHKNYNLLHMSQINQGPIGDCSLEEIDTFYRILNMLSELYK